MAQLSETDIDRLLPLIPGERFELALDEKLGAVTTLDSSPNVLSVTNLRVINRADEGGKRVTSVLTLHRITAVEVSEARRPQERLSQGLMVLGIGLVLAVISWFVVGLMLITLVVGGFPILAAIYMLLGYAFPDAENELVILSGAHAIRRRLLSANARQDAYLVAGRISELMAASVALPEHQTAPLEAAPPFLSNNGSPVTHAPTASWWAMWGAPPGP